MDYRTRALPNNPVRDALRPYRERIVAIQDELHATVDRDKRRALHERLDAAFSEYYAAMPRREDVAA